jgi:hypothetical protein
MSKERGAGGPAVESGGEAGKQWFTARGNAETNTLFLNYVQKRPMKSQYQVLLLCR